MTEEMEQDLFKIQFSDTEYSTKQKLLLGRLKQLDCPFTWETISESAKEHMRSVSLFENKYEEVERDNGVFAWNKIILKFVLCYCYFEMKILKKSLSALKEIEDIIAFCNTPEASDELSISIKNAINLVLLGMKAYLKFYSNELEYAEKILNDINEKSFADDKFKAAMYGIQGAVLMELPPKGTETAVIILKKAILLDPCHPEWHFLLGKCLSRIRRRFIDNLLPDSEEIDALKRATELGNNANYVIFLAQTYGELSSSAHFRKMKYLPHIRCCVDEINKLSYNLYRNALEMKPECASVNTRCCMGFQKLPYPYKDLDLAKRCANTALILSPDNPFVNETVGLLYTKLQDIPKALKYLKLAGDQGSYSAYLMYITVKYSRYSSFDPLPDLLDMQKKFCKDLLRNVETLCQIGSYYHLIKKNFDVAAKYWMEAIQLDPQSDRLQNHKCILHSRGITKVNIYNLLLEEANKRKWKAVTREEYSRYDEIINICSKHYIY